MSHLIKRPEKIYSFNTFGGRPLLRYLLAEYREAILNVLGSLSLSPEEVLYGNRILSLEQQGPIWGLACQLRVKDPLLSFRAALLHDIHDSGLPGMLARSSSNLRETIDIHKRYLFQLDSEGVLSEVQVGPEKVDYVFPRMLGMPDMIQEYALATTWVALTALTPQLKKYMHAMELPRSYLDRGFTELHLKQIMKDYGTPLVFSSSRVALTLSAEALDEPFPGVDPNLNLLLLKKLRVFIGDLLSEDPEELREQIHAVIVALGQVGEKVDLASVAKYLGIQPEKLAYCLRTHRIFFTQLKEQSGIGTKADANLSR